MKWIIPILLVASFSAQAGWVTSPEIKGCVVKDQDRLIPIRHVIRMDATGDGGIRLMHARGTEVLLFSVRADRDKFFTRLVDLLSECR